MDYSKLTATYDDLFERIDQYFDGELRSEPRAKVNLETYKDELLQELQIVLWRKHKRKKYDTYDPKTFIWLNAKTVWITFTGRLNQKSNQKSDIEFANLPETSFVNNFLQEFESKDMFSVIESLLSDSEIELLRYRRLGKIHNCLIFKLPLLDYY